MKKIKNKKENIRIITREMLENDFGVVYINEDGSKILLKSRVDGKIREKKAV